MAETPSTGSTGRHLQTLAVTAGRPTAAGDPLNQPITLASTFHTGGARGYGREGNPGWDALEQAIGVLEEGDAVAFASGLAASAAVFSWVKPGGIVVAPLAPYHGVTSQLKALAGAGVAEVRTVDLTDEAALARQIVGADMVWVESPSNPMIDVVDIDAVVHLAKEQGAIVAVDSTFATPLLQRPLTLGADVVVHSATKFIGGHSDLILGIAVVADHELTHRLRESRHREGAIPGVLESFLALRGLRTLSVRLERAQASALKLATLLSEHPVVSKVRYPGLPSHPQHQVASRQMSGYGAMLSFETLGEPDAVERMCENFSLIVHATSLGGVETLVERRARYEGDRTQGVPPTLLRMSVGLEHVDDLWEDLKCGLEGIEKVS